MQGAGCRVQGAGCKVQGAGCRDPRVEGDAVGDGAVVQRDGPGLPARFGFWGLGCRDSHPGRRLGPNLYLKWRTGNLSP